MADDPYAEYRIQSGTAPATPAMPEDQYSAYRLFGSSAATSPRSSAPSLTAAPDDKYRAEAIKTLLESRAKGRPIPGSGQLGGMLDAPGYGAGIGWTEDVIAGGMAPLESIKRGVSLPEGYRYSRAYQDLMKEEYARNKTGAATAAELAGGLSTGAGVLGGGTRLASPTANYLLNVGKGAGFGTVAGAGEAPRVENVPYYAGMGGVLGAGISASLPALGAVAGPATRALQMPRLRDPEKIATEQIAETMRRGGVTPDEVVQRIRDAQAAGQPYIAAEAIGNEGVRKLAGMAKQPGEQRQLIAETLAARNVDMPIRTGAEVNRALGVQGSAEQAREALIERASKQAGPVYRVAEQFPTWSEKLQTFLDDPIAKSGLRHGVELQRLRSVGSDRPFKPTDAQITGFNEAGDPIITGTPNMQTLHTLKVGLDRMIESEVNPATGKLNARGNTLSGFKNRMLSEIDELNPEYARARRIYSDPMRTAEAVRVGEAMPRSGLAEDTLGAYRALSPNEQAGVRIGYATGVREPLERTGNLPTILREKSPKGVAELEALSQYQGPRRPGEGDPLRKFLTREEEMLRTNVAARGGSATAENIADITASPGGSQALGLAQAAFSGSPWTMLKGGYEALQRFGRGENEAQRLAITRALLAQNPDQVQQMAARIADYELRRRGVNPFVNRPPRYPEGQ